MNDPPQTRFHLTNESTTAHNKQPHQLILQGGNKLLKPQPPLPLLPPVTTIPLAQPLITGPIDPDNGPDPLLEPELLADVDETEPVGHSLVGVLDERTHLVVGLGVGLFQLGQDGEEAGEFLGLGGGQVEVRGFGGGGGG